MLLQEKYLREILQRFNMENCHAIATLMEAGSTLSHTDLSQQDGINQLPNNVPYPHAIGCLMHAIVQRKPECAFIVCSLTQHLSNFDSTHWKSVKRVLSYINGTCSFGIKYCKKPNGNILIGYSDVDWAGDKDTRRSRICYCFLLAGVVVSWASKKQTFVALSSTDS